MRTIRLSALLACLMAAGLAGAQTAPAPAAAASAPAGPTMRAELRTILLDTQNLMGEKKIPAAKEKIQAANAVADKTPYESFITARVGLAVAIAEDDAASAAKLLEQMLQLNASGAWLTVEETLPLMQAVGVAHYRIKDYAQAAAWMERNIKAGGSEQSVRDARVQSYLLAGNLARGSELLTEEVAAAEKAKKVPAQAYLEMLAQARTSLKDTAGSTKALEMLVQYYPSKDHWRNLINRLWGRSDLASRLQLDVFRLAFFVSTPEEASDYGEYIDFAQKAGYSAEALRVHDQGASAGLLGSSEAHKKQRTKLAHEVEQDRKTLTADTAAALKKPDGFALFNIGLNQIGMQQFDKGLELMEKAIAKGMPKRPEDARLRLAVAYVQAGQTDKALQTFATVSGPEGLDDIVRYWTWAIRKP
ncbi:MAG: tetratricopeptide repeat protein [Burkholderiales bacterium]|nr:tetratricopeptide repeat protein [Burkholderiales bacterium]